MNETAGKKILSWNFVCIILVVGILCLRATYTESPQAPTMDAYQPLTNEAYSVILSTALMAAAGAWLAGQFLRRQWTYRSSGMGIGIAMWAAAAGVGIGVASHTRAAVTEAGLWMSGMITAVMLTQWLDRRHVRLVLMAVVSLAAVNLYQCWEQRSAGNTMLIEEYEKDPEAQLRLMGIEPGTFQASLYEHRLYSRDIRGFFKTSNSAGSFAILAVFAAAALMAQRWRQAKEDPTVRGFVALDGLMGIAVLGALAISQSKGAIGSAIVGGAMFAAWRLWGNWMRRHRILLTMAIVFSVFIGVGATIHTGLQNGRLPGGNGMLVRWQYWVGAAEMIKEHPLTGVGGGNFGTYYTQYKSPESLETVQDPHNMALSVLSQYGPLGLAGFLLAAGWPVVRGFYRRRQEPDSEPTADGGIGPWAVGIVGAVLCIVMLAVRPVLMRGEQAGTEEQRIFVYIYLHVTPVLVFAAAMIIFAFGKRARSKALEEDSTARALLDCGIAATLIANLVDFAIFEPGVWTAFWMMLACRSAMGTAAKRSIRLPASMRAAAIGFIAAAGWGWWTWGVEPAVRAGRLHQEAMRAPTAMQATELLGEAIEADALNPDWSRILGITYLQIGQANRQPEAVRKAIAALTLSAMKNPAGFKAFEKLSESYEQLAELSAGAEQKRALEQAMEWARQMTRRYPASDRGHLRMARLAERLGDAETAGREYRRVVEIEDAFREMFRTMYPGRTMVSRIGEKEYLEALQKSGGK